MIGPCLVYRHPFLPEVFHRGVGSARGLPQYMNSEGDDGMMRTKDRVQEFLKNQGDAFVYPDGLPKVSAIARAMGISRERVSKALDRPFKGKQRSRSLRKNCWCGRQIGPKSRACRAHSQRHRMTAPMVRGGVYLCRKCARPTRYEELVFDRNSGWRNGGKIPYCKRCRALRQALQYGRTHRRTRPYSSLIYPELDDLVNGDKVTYDVRHEGVRTANGSSNGKN